MVLRYSVSNNILGDNMVVLINFGRCLLFQRLHGEKNFMKNIVGTTAICDQIDGITVISNLILPPYVHQHLNAEKTKRFQNRIQRPKNYKLIILINYVFCNAVLRINHCMMCKFHFFYLVVVVM